AARPAQRPGAARRAVRRRARPRARAFLPRAHAGRHGAGVLGNRRAGTRRITGRRAGSRARRSSRRRHGARRMIAPDARVLVIAVARIGDTLLATPLLRALKAALPTGRLEVRAHPRRLDVLRHLPFIDRLSGLGKWAAWLGTARLGTLLPGR